MITDPAHVKIAKVLRREHAACRDAEQGQARRHHDGDAVMLRALLDYDAAFGVDFTPAPATDDESSGAVSSEATPT